MQNSYNRPKTATEFVADTVRAEILSGSLRQNEPIRQEEIAARLDVSRMPVREAIRRLAAEGWIEERPNRMATVASLDPEDARELFSLRAELECIAIKNAFPKFSAPQLDRIDATHKALAEAPQRDYMKRHRAFHMALYAGAGRRLLGLIEHHIDVAERYLRFEQSEMRVEAEDIAGHDALRGAAFARDISRATTILHSHVRDAGDDIARNLETINEDKA